MTKATIHYNSKPDELVPEAILGDVDGDGILTVNDATDIQKYAADMIDFTDEIKKIADIDGDGEVTVLDATAVQKLAAGIKI